MNTFAGDDEVFGRATAERGKLDGVVDLDIRRLDLVAAVKMQPSPTCACRRTGRGRSKLLVKIPLARSKDGEGRGDSQAAALKLGRP